MRVVYNFRLEVDTVKLFVLSGADVSRVNKKNQTPYEFIKDRGRLIESIKTEKTAIDQIIKPEILSKFGNPAMFLRDRQYGLKEINKRQLTL